MNNTYYDPELTLTHPDPSTNDYVLGIRVYYPAGETGTIVSNVVRGNTRFIEIDVVADPSARHDHFVTSTEHLARETGENQIEVTVKWIRRGESETHVATVGTCGRSAVATGSVLCRKLMINSALRPSVKGRSRPLGFRLRRD